MSFLDNNKDINNEINTNPINNNIIFIYSSFIFSQLNTMTLIHYKILLI